jgi:starch phosphorylase
MAGKEASGTGNMKLSLNGALTMGTLDGANLEIRDAVGAENFFLFGLTAEEVQSVKSAGYQPWSIYHDNHQLRTVIDDLNSGLFSQGDPKQFRPITDALLNQDEYLLFADYQSYIEAQHDAAQCYRDLEVWARKSILNVARMGGFSSDRSIRDYCRDIWYAEPVDIALDVTAAALEPEALLKRSA